MKRIMSVKSHITKQTVGKPTLYRVELQFEKDRLAVHSLNHEIFDKLPRGQKFSVDIKPTEQTQLTEE